MNRFQYLGEGKDAIQIEMEAIRKKMASLRLALDESTEKRLELEKKLRDEQDRADAAEAEVKNLNSKLILLEEDNGKQEEALGDTRRRLETIEVEADENLRARKVLETRSASDDDKIADLESQLGTSKTLQEEADHKYDESQRKLQMTEQQLEVAEAKNTEFDSKVAQLTDEITTLRNNCKSLEAQDRESTEREEKYEAQIKTLSNSLDEASNRAEGAEGQVKSLQHQVDTLEETVCDLKAKHNEAMVEQERLKIELMAI